MANVNKYTTAGFMFNWKAIPAVKELSDDYGVDLENLELIVNGLKNLDNTYKINVYARVDGYNDLTHLYNNDSVTEADIAKTNGIANYYTALVQKIARDSETDWYTVYEQLLNTDFDGDDLDWDSLDDIVFD